MSEYTIKEVRDAGGTVRAVVLPRLDGMTVIPPTMAREAFREAQLLGATDVVFACRVWVDDPNGWRFQKLNANGMVMGWSREAPAWLRPYVASLV